MRAFIVVYLTLVCSLFEVICFPHASGIYIYIYNIVVSLR